MHQAVLLVPELLSLAVLFQLIMTYTKYGKHSYAIGSNEDAARIFPGYLDSAERLTKQVDTWSASK